MWLGVSVEDQATGEERIPVLLNTPAALRWVSAEPLLGPLDLSQWLPDLMSTEVLGGGSVKHEPTIDWVVAGGESGPHARIMRRDWLISLRNQCVASGVPFFFKQWGEWIPNEEVNPQQEQQAIRMAAKVAMCENPVEYFMRIGKKNAGRSLNGLEWNGFPETAQSVGNEISSTSPKSL